MHYIFSPIRSLIIFFIFAVVIFWGIKNLKSNPKNLVIYILLSLCLPIGANIALILAPATKAVHLHMTASMLFVIPLMLSFLDCEITNMKKVICALGVLLLYGNILALGTDIDALSQGSNTTYAIMNNIVTSLNEKGLLGREYEYAFYGNPAENELFQVNELYDNASNYAKFGTLQIKPDMVRNAYGGLFDDIGVNLTSVEYDTYEQILNSKQLDDMASYPAEGSIVEKDGIVIVKVSDDY